MKFTTDNQPLSALQVTVLAGVAIFMVARSTYEVLVMLGKLAYKLGQYAARKYQVSNLRTETTDDVIEAVKTEAKEIKLAGGKYLCGIHLTVSTIHAAYIYLSNFDYVESVRVEGIIRNRVMNAVDTYIMQWKKAVS